jgi:hypothetical protein
VTRVGPLVVVGAMLLTLPLVAWQGPGGTTPMDFVNLLFLGGYWAVLLARRESIRLPLLGPFLVVMAGSALGLWTAVDRGLAVLTVVQEIYLYAWFVTLAHFLGRHCHLDQVVTLWVAIASLVAVGTLADAHFGVLGGNLAGGQRALGTFENPNMYGSYLVVAFFVACAGAATGRPILWLALPVLFAGIRATASNGALLGFLGGIAALVVALPMSRSVTWAGAALIVAALAIAVVGIWREPLTHAATEVFGRERGAVGGAALKGYGERYPLWLDALDQIRAAPTGVGPGNFNVRGGRNSRTHLSAHNEYLGMLTERGPLGLLGWCGIVLGVFGLVRRLGDEAARGVPTLAVVGLYGFAGAIITHAFVIELSHFRHVWLAFALLAAAVTQAVAQRESVLAAPFEEAA